MSVSKGSKADKSYGHFSTIQLNRTRFLILRALFVVTLIVSWIFLVISLVDLLGETVLPTFMGGGTVENVINAVHFDQVIWMIIVVVIISVLNLILRRNKK